VRLSVVVPLYNEAAVLPELEARCRAAAGSIEGGVELLFVDDHGTDGSADQLAAMPPPVRHIRLPENRGQWGATCEGLRQARGELVAVMDGDLQDPPELLPQLVDVLHQNNHLDVVFATKSSRRDPLWFRLGRQGYRTAQFVVNAGNVVPSGAGAYCVMRRPLARRAAEVRLDNVNLAAVLTAMRPRATTVPFARAARADGDSRVGPLGLAKEALGSLLVLSPLGRRWLPRA